MKHCPKCLRPLWDGGHAISPAECQGERDERCSLLWSLRQADSKLVTMANDLKEARRERDRERQRREDLEVENARLVKQLQREDI